ncbi:chromosomal replication initiator, DnaA-like protein [Mesorhizobium alhagi CCNWXJ12-2]|uniref:Chromosomal replication initiator, DnaA-like protein n=1 Tax=Mesorhizobium alhagi CCNWXJ12-2 TaxID=1107882 RepID=H0I0C8_9HYPH|nr:chromosomal replication initiator, DnaA-like protein [Mesorhizobium alhagi CCNWXJ12-2]
MCEGMIDIVAALFNVSGKELRRSGRADQSITRVRQIAMYVSHVVLRLSMNEVGHGFGRDRTTVLYACHLIEDMRDDEDFDCLVARAERVALAAFRNRIGL